ncbi:DNA polymerase V [Malonomonas rubra DSM 5091]|uniref:DNA polymerase V n=1 Tax=Malonomonas rubra DSM 5091 TaxID=1122189 RepID=A0A1M6KY87_MALRU|nr:translesion error-prone DNA polymerase V subunit UmuC [Malonomonas rubra]SHJ63907.1 DNA polymerase V [Malonomonas rubra DSM 5091]
MKTFALVDCNNFYASCERLFRPDLKSQPVAVLSNNDGCIVARSQEVKDLGIKMGEPLFKVQDLLQQHGAHIFSSNYTLYGDISSRVMQTLETFSPHVEIYSIDEAFLDLSGFRELTAYCGGIKRTVFRHVGIPVSVGTGPTKTLAKLANHAAKKLFPEEGVVDLSDRLQSTKILQRVPVSEVWGVGRQHTKRLKTIGVHTAYDLSQLQQKFVRKHFSVVMERTVRELNGESCIELEEISPPKKQIICSRSFGDKITEYRLMREAICEFTARAAEKLRREKRIAAALTVFIRTSPFDNLGTYYGNAATQSLFQATSNTQNLLSLSTKLLKEIWKDGHRYTKAGVMLSDFSPEKQQQLSLLHDPAIGPESKSLMEAIDLINQRAGGIWFGGQRPKKDWFMRQARLSPAYTTRWDSLPFVEF